VKGKQKSSLAWQKSSFSGEPHQECIEVAATRNEQRCFLRESDVPEIVLTTTPARLAALLSAITAGVGA
jgi:hypothetical protein